MENLGGFLGSLGSGAFGLIGNAINFKYQQALADKQNQFNLDMWHLNNEYNSPQAQMKRFEDAGLNAALIYNQGSSGLSSSPPVQTVPEAPNISKDLTELGKSFNIENLKTVIANRKKAQADAKNAQTDARRNEDRYEAEIMFGNNYQLDPITGKFVLKPRSGAEKTSGAASAWYYLNNLLADNFRTNSLLVPRGNLIGSQRDLNLKRINLLAPQIRYWNFNTEPWRMKTNFWIGNVKNGVQAISPFF